jgi:hypothetical protein
VRRLEKTVESLSHGLILALTELQDFRGRTAIVGGCKSDNSGTVDALSIALSGLSTAVDHLDGTGTSAPDDTHLCPSKQPDQMTTRRKSASQHKSTKLKAAEKNDDIVTETDSSIFISDDRSPISGLLKPILDFMACPVVRRFLKWAEAHPGLRSTQFFDLLWVANNFFNVHGGVRCPSSRRGELIALLRVKIDYDILSPKILHSYGRYFWSDWLECLVSRSEVDAGTR